VRRQYEQAEPPGPVTCAIYAVGVLVIVAGIVYIALKTGGFI